MADSEFNLRNIRDSYHEWILMEIWQFLPNYVYNPVCM